MKTQTEQPLKKRKGFGHIVIDGDSFTYTWTKDFLLIYDKEGKRHQIAAKSEDCGTDCGTGWFGKVKSGPNFGPYGKAAAANAWRRYRREIY